MTNKQFVTQFPSFKNFCIKENIVPTARQASAYRRGFGLVYLIEQYGSMEKILERAQKLDPLFQIKGIERHRRVHNHNS